MKRWWLSVGLGAVALLGWSSDAEAAFCLTSLSCPAEAPICAGNACKPCSNSTALLSCTQSVRPTYTCSTSGPTAGQCVAPTSTSSSTGGLVIDLGINLGTSTSSGSSTGGLGIDLGVNLGSSSSSTSGSSTGGLGIDLGVNLGSSSSSTSGSSTGGLGIDLGVNLGSSSSSTSGSSTGGLGIDLGVNVGSSSSSTSGSSTGGLGIDLGVEVGAGTSSSGGIDLGVGVGVGTSSSSSSSTGGVGVGIEIGIGGSSGGAPDACQSDSECGSVSSGLICDALTKACVAGCRVGGNACSFGLQCTNILGGIGVCLLPQGSSSSSGGTPSAPECNEDSDCGEILSGTVCNATSKKCQPGCRASLGNACGIGLDCTFPTLGLAIGVCLPVVPPNEPAPPAQCTADADCGSAASGHVCDALTGSCIAGCRVSLGGNACPIGLTCNPNFDLFGKCVYVPELPSTSSSSSSSSGGADAGKPVIPGFPESRNPILGGSAGIAANGGVQTGSSGANVAADVEESFEVQGGGCNVGSSSDRTATTSLVGLLLGFAALVRNRRKQA